MEHDGPLPRRYGRPCEKNENAADRFRSRHTPHSPQSNKVYPEKTNQNSPALTNELDKRRSIRKPDLDSHHH